jgi:hypothetical protein
MSTLVSPVNPFPSSIPILKTRSNSPSRVIREHGRDSPEFERGAYGIVTEGLIKNELPPFRLLADERTSVTESGNGEGEALGYGSDEDGAERRIGGEVGRKRAVTMRNDPSISKQGVNGGRGNNTIGTRTRKENAGSGFTPTKHPGGASSQTSNISRSASGIGLGQPPSRNLAISSTSKPRSSSSRSPGQTSGSSSSSSPPHPRSASLNMLASSRTTYPLAHLVPPDQTYKPPAGVNFDEMVTPASAKKMAEAGSGPGGTGEFEEGDLAIEYDKEGRPVKWIKWNRGKSGAKRLDTSVNSNVSFFFPFFGENQS